MLKAVKALGFTEPTPIQRDAIPHMLEGRDVIGSAQTGTGKTAAWAPSSVAMVTNANPRDRPLMRSVIKFTSVTGPNFSKRS